MLDRPICLVLLSYLCGSTCAYCLAVPASLMRPYQLLFWSCCAGCSSLAVAVLCARRGALARKKLAAFSLWLACACAGAIRSSQRLLCLEWPFAQQSITVQFEATVVSDVTTKDSYLNFLARLETPVHRYDARDKLVAVTAKPNGGLLEYGDRIKCQGYLVPPQAPGNPGEFDQRAAFAASGIWAQLRCTRYTRVGPSTSASPIKLLLRLKHRAVMSINRSLCAPVSGLLVGMLFGDTGALEPQLLEQIRDVGVAHVLAVSGLHVNFIRSLLQPLKKLVNPREYALCVTLCLAAYAVMAGASASILRALIMASMGFLQVPALRNKDPLASLAGSALVICFFRPMAHLGMGFQLSYLATLGLIISEELPIGDTLSRVPGLRATLGATAFAAPLVVARWNSLALVSPVSNLVMVPLAGLLVKAGVLVSLVSTISICSGIIAPVCTGVDILGLTFLILGQLFGRLPLASVTVPSPGAAWLCCYYGLISVATGLLSPPPRLRCRVTAACVVALLVVTAVPFLAKPVCRVTFLDVGQGDCILVESSNAVALVDTGPLVSGGSRTLSYLRRKGISRLDYLLVTHWHEDHAGALGAILNAINVRAVVCPGPPPGSAEVSRLACAKVLVPEETSPMALNLGSCRLEVITCAEQLANQASNENQRALLSKLTCSGVEVLLPADLPAQTVIKNMVFLAGGAQFKVLKIPHHGAADSCLAKLLDNYRPDVCVISVGVNSYGHPSEATLNLLNSRNIQVHRTDRDGAILVQLDSRGNPRITGHRTP